MGMNLLSKRLPLAGRLHRLLFRGDCSAGVPSLGELRGADRRHVDEDLEAHRHAPHSFVARYLT